MAVIHGDIVLYPHKHLYRHVSVKVHTISVREFLQRKTDLTEGFYSSTLTLLHYYVIKV